MDNRAIGLSKEALQCNAIDELAKKLQRTEDSIVSQSILPKAKRF